MFGGYQYSPMPRHGSEAINFSMGSFHRTSLLWGVLAGLCGCELRAIDQSLVYFSSMDVAILT